MLVFSGVGQLAEVDRGETWMALDCGIQWFSGSAEGEFVVPDALARQGIAFAIGSSVALGNAWAAANADIMADWNQPCPQDRCPNKTGALAYSAEIRERNKNNIHKITCLVHWLMNINCSGNLVPKPFPDPADYDRLEEDHREYLKLK